MKLRFKTLAATSLVLSVFSFSTVYAVDATTTTANPSAATSTTSSSGSTTGAASASGSTANATTQKELNARLQKRITDMKTKLTAAQQTRIKTRCKNAQGTIQSVGKKVDGIQTSRTAVYDGLVARLTSLATKLKAQGVDVAALESEITVLKAKIATYNTDLATYKQAVTDLSAMDCTADPTAFQASLEAARAALNTVRTDSSAVHDYVKNTIRPTLEKIKSQLQNSTTSNAAGSTVGGNN